MGLPIPNFSPSDEIPNNPFYVKPRPINILNTIGEYVVGDGLYVDITKNTLNSSGGEGSVTLVETGTGLTGGPITSSGTISLEAVGVATGTYTFATINVDAYGRVKLASNGLTATATQPGIIRKATQAETLTGIDDSSAVTPLDLQFKIRDSITLSDARYIASSKAVSDLNNKIGDSILKTAFTAKGGLLAGTAASSFTELKTPGTSGLALVTSPATLTGLDWQPISSLTCGIPPGIFTAKGDILVSTSAATPVALSVGQPGQVLAVNPARPSLLDWTDVTSLPGIIDSACLSTSGSLLVGNGTAKPVCLLPGNQGQYLSVVSPGNLGWVTPSYIPSTCLSQPGELLTYSQGQVTALPVAPTDGYLLTVNTACNSKLEWVPNPAVLKSAYSATKGAILVGANGPDPQLLAPGNDGLALVACSADPKGVAWGQPTQTTAISRSCILGLGSLVAGCATCCPVGVPAGSDGQFLTACSACVSTGGVTWVTPSSGGGCIPSACITEAGTIITGSAANTPVALPLGADGQVLTVKRSAPTGYNIVWEAPPASTSIPCACLTEKGSLVVGTAPELPGTLAAAPADNLVLTSCSACTTGLTWASGGGATVQPATPGVLGTVYGCTPSTAIVTSFGFCAGSSLAGPHTQNTAVGYFSMTQMSTGCFNVGVGTYALQNSVAGCHNIAVGFNSLLAVSGTGNIALGGQTGVHVSSGSENAFIGLCSGYCSRQASRSVGIGACTLFNNQDGNSNIAIGKQSLYFSVSSGNISIGECSGYYICSSTENVAIGNQTLATSSTGNSNAVLGFNAMQYSYGSNNVSLGSFALKGVSGSTVCNNDNIAVGYKALCNSSGTCFNVAIGTETMLATSTGCYNVAVGNRSLFTNTTASFNVGVGDCALCSNQTGTYNTAVGARSMLNHVNGIDNTAVGACAIGGVSGSGCYNTAVGSQSLFNLANGCYNVGIGLCALFSNTYCNWNTAVGAFSQFSNVQGVNNSSLGACSLYHNSSGLQNTAMGFETLRCNVTGCGNSSFGVSSNRLNTCGCFNTSVGYFSLSESTGGSQNVAVGKEALSFNTASNNVAVGTCALRCNFSGSSNIAVGECAMANASGSLCNIGIGCGALRLNSGRCNIGIGYCANGNGSTGCENIAIGTNAFLNGGGGCNTAIGTCVLQQNTGSTNVGLGYWALYNNTSGAGNVAIGLQANAASCGSSCNVSVGYCASQTPSATVENVSVGAFSGPAGFVSNLGKTVYIGARAGCLNSGSWNTAVGAETLLSSAGENVAVGYQAGICVNSFSNCNVAIGYQALANSSQQNNVIAIGHKAGTDGLDPNLNRANFVIIGNQQSCTYCTNAGWEWPGSPTSAQTQVTALPLGLDFVNSLNPVKFKPLKNGQPGDNFEYGLDPEEIVASEENSLGDGVIIKQPAPGQYSYASHHMIPVLVQAIKQLSDKVDLLEQQIQTLQANP